MIDQVLFFGVALPVLVYLKQRVNSATLKSNTELAAETLRKIRENEALIAGLHGPFNAEAADVLAVATLHLAETRSKLIEWQSKSDWYRGENEPPWLYHVIIEDLEDLAKFQQKQK